MDPISGKLQARAAANRTYPTLQTPSFGLFAPDGRRFACMATDQAFGHQLMQWDVERRRELPRIAGSYFQGLPLSYSADGRFLAAVMASVHENMGWPVVEVACWEVATGKQCLRFEFPPFGKTPVALSPDGRCLATSTANGKIRLWDIASAKHVGDLHGHAGFITALQFGSDGKTLFSASEDTTVLIWDMTRLRLPRQPLGTLEKCWADLAREDPAIACRAVWALADAAATAVPYLAARLKPAESPRRQHVQRLLTDLGSDDVDQRQAALTALEHLGCPIEGQVEQALKSATELATRHRLQRLLEYIRGVPAPIELQRIRAVQVLELIGSAEARRVLHVLADGAPGARLTWDAQAALARLEKR